MSYRPYPSADRALRQIDQHHVPQPVSVSEQSLRLLEQAAAYFAAAREGTRPSCEMIEVLQARSSTLPPGALALSPPGATLDVVLVSH